MNKVEKGVERNKPPKKSRYMRVKLPAERQIATNNIKKQQHRIKAEKRNGNNLLYL